MCMAAIFAAIAACHAFMLLLVEDAAAKSDGGVLERGKMITLSSPLHFLKSLTRNAVSRPFLPFLQDLSTAIVRLLAETLVLAVVST
jgi:hypothetical protein